MRRVLACRYVDEVVIGAPMQITRETLTTLNVHVVARPSVLDVPAKDDAAARRIDASYALAAERGILHAFESPSTLTVPDIIHRIVERRVEFQKRYDKKSKSEAAYMEKRTYVQEA